MGVARRALSVGAYAHRRRGLAEFERDLIRARTEGRDLLFTRSERRFAAAISTASPLRISLARST